MIKSGRKENLSKKTFSKLAAFVSMLMCFLIIFNSGAVAVESNRDFLDVDSITISDRHGIVEGKTSQLEAVITPENTVASAVAWSSSNPSVVSCTEDGVIKGISAGGYADIVCKAKFGNAQDKIRIYCVESIGDFIECDFKGYFNYFYAEPSNTKPIALHFNYMMLLRDFFKYFSDFWGLFSLALSVKNEFSFSGGKCYILGKYGSYAYIAFGSDGVTRDGFIKYTKLEDSAGIFLNLSPTDMDVWGNGKTYDNKKLTTKYKGDITWTVGDDEIISFDPTTKQVVGLKPGTTTITATADGVSQTCIVHSLYRWPQIWETKTNRDTSLYNAKGFEYQAYKAMPEGKPFTVYGDNGTSDGWAYGNITGTNYWGYVPVSHVSTKNTISFYANLGWDYPLANKDYNLIYSPFAPRRSKNDEHRGIDINEKANQADIEGQKLVAAFDGIVKDAGFDSSAGYFVCITSNNDTDPVTGEKIIAIYMHMRDLPLVSAGDEVIKGGTLVGYAGNTGGSDGSHLHFEANNKNAVVDDKIRRSYTDTINPIYFYMDREFEFNNTCSAATEGYGFYWYNYNK